MSMISQLESQQSICIARLTDQYCFYWAFPVAKTMDHGVYLDAH